MSKLSKIHYMDFNALNVMHVKVIKDTVCSFYTILHTEYCNVTNFTHVKGVEGVKYYVLYPVYSDHSFLQEGRPVQPSILWI